MRNSVLFKIARALTPAGPSSKSKTHCAHQKGRAMVFSTPGVETGCVRDSYTWCRTLWRPARPVLIYRGASPTFSAERAIATGDDFLQLRLENAVKARRFRPVKAGSEGSEASSAA